MKPCVRTVPRKLTQVFEFFSFHARPAPPAGRPFIGSSECLRCASLRLQLSWISLGEIGKDSSWNCVWVIDMGLCISLKFLRMEFPLLSFVLPWTVETFVSLRMKFSPSFSSFSLFFSLCSCISKVRVSDARSWLNFGSVVLLLDGEKTRDTEIHYCSLVTCNNAVTGSCPRWKNRTKNWSIISRAGNFFGFAEKHLSCAFRPDDCH